MASNVLNIEAKRSVSWNINIWKPMVRHLRFLFLGNSCRRVSWISLRTKYRPRIQFRQMGIVVKKLLWMKCEQFHNKMKKMYNVTLPLCRILIAQLKLRCSIELSRASLWIVRLKLRRKCEWMMRKCGKKTKWIIHAKNVRVQLTTSDSSTFCLSYWTVSKDEKKNTT